MKPNDDEESIQGVFLYLTNTLTAMQEEIVVVVEHTSAFSCLLPSCLAFALTKSMLSSLSSALALSTAWDLAILLVSLHV